jgi:phosphoesterase RecJ-like protein
MTRLGENELERAADLIAGSKTALILGHQYPDGDAIGSALAVAIALGETGRQVQASWPEPFELPHKYAFLPGKDYLVRPGDARDADVTISLDCATADRMQELKDRALARPTLINIDHHPDNRRFGAVNLVEPEASATAEIIYRRAADLGLPINIDAALCLYVGIVTDTGRFQFSNTSAGTLEAASEIVAMGVEPNVIYENVYQSDSLEYIRLSGEVLMNAVYDSDLGLIYACLMQSDLKEFGVKMSETEDLIDDLRALKGHMVTALFKETGDGSIRVSLRSRVDCDIGSIARKLGGGGHRVAAGYTSGKKNIAEAVEELKGEIVESGGSAGCR